MVAVFRYSIKQLYFFVSHYPILRIIEPLKKLLFVVVDASQYDFKNNIITRIL